MQQQHRSTEELAQVRGKFRRLPRIFGKIVARDDPSGRPDVLSASHYQNRAVRVVNDVLGLTTHQHASQASVAMASHQQQAGVKLIAQLYDLLKGSPFPEVGSRDGSSHISDPLYLLVEDLTALPLELPLHESVCAVCVHIVPDVDQVKL